MAEDLKLTRLTLIQRLKDTEDSSAWAEFQDFYWQLIVGWAKMYGCSENQAKDVFQETMINLLKNMPDFQYMPSKGCFRSYLKTIVSRRVKDAFRRDSRYLLQSKDAFEDSSDFFQELPDETPQCEAEMDIHWLQTILQQAIRQACHKVSPLTYKSFCLHVLDELPVQIVGKKLGVKRERTIYEHKRRFLEILQREFSTLLDDFEDIDSSGNSREKKVAFLGALEEYLKSRKECRDTVISQPATKGLFKQIEFVSQVLEHRPDNYKTGCYLVRCHGFDDPSTIQDQDWLEIKNSLKIGRLNECDLVLSGDKISGLHASLVPVAQSWSLKDENSTNGVFLNGQRLKDEELLKNGDIIQFSERYQYIFFDFKEHE